MKYEPKDAQKEVDLHLDVRKIAIPFFYGRYRWITSFGTIIHSPQKLWQGLDMKRIAIISAETRNSKKEVFFLGSLRVWRHFRFLSLW